jgi:RNA polymerase sigma-70 factor (ECF subfamily)
MQNANSSEIVALIARHQARLRGLVRCLLVRVADVDDVLQEVNSVLWEKANEFETGTDFWAWASQIARFKALNHIRKYNRDRLVFDDKLLNELPPPQRQLIDLRYAGGHAIESIAEIIGRPQASIRQTLYRIRQALLACIESKLQSEGGVT